MIHELLRQAQINSHTEFDSALARKLKVSRQTVSNWRMGRTFPDAVSCARIADLAGLPLQKVLGMVGEERANDQEEKAVWRRLANIAAMVCVVTIGTVGPAFAGSDFDTGAARFSHNYPRIPIMS